MVEHQLKGLCYNCDDKYFLGHTCKEHNIFMDMTEDFSEEEDDVSHVPEIPPLADINSPSDPPEVKPLISLNALPGLCYPQILKLIGYINLLLIFMITLTPKTHHLGHLTKLKQTSPVEEFISSFEQFVFRTEGMADGFFREFFISGLNDEMCAHVLIYHPHNCLEDTKRAKES
jgi:hypothetical protein